MTHSPPIEARPSRRKVAVSVALTGAAGVAVAAFGLPTMNATAAEGDTVQILSFNDYHGHIEDDTPGSIDGSFGGPAAGGGEYLSTKLTELRDGTTAPDSYTVAAGDLIGGSPFFSGLFKDEPSVESLNAMELDFSGVGNHEFDEGVDELLRMQNGGCFDTDGDMAPVGTDDADDCFFPADPYEGADFQWLAANVTEDAPDGTDDFEDSIFDYAIETTSTGEKIAFIGMTLEGTPALVAAAGIAGFSFEDEVTAGAATVAAIQADDPDVEAIVLMLHEGGIPTTFDINGCTGISGPIVEIAENLDAEIDAIITGHTHQPYTCTIDDPDGDPRPVLSAWEFGKVVTELTLTFDGAGDIVREGAGAPVMLNHEVLQSELEPDAAITAIIEKWTPLAEAIGDDEVGRISADITRGGDPTGSDRGVESDAGNMVADAQKFGVEDAGIDVDLALMNPGGLRSDLLFAATNPPETEDGIITFGEAFTFQPFGNTMFVLDMTGAQIKAVLEEQCQPEGSSRPFLHLGVSDGFTYDLAATTQDGVCTAIEVSNVQLDGSDLEDATEYAVAVNNFLADGGDNFNTFEEVPADKRTPGPQDIDALITYLSDDMVSPVDPPGTERVNETLTMLPDAPTAVAPGRILETRSDQPFPTETVDGLFQEIGRLDAGETVELQVAGRGGVADDAESANLQIGAVDPEGDGFITVYPCDEEQPVASSINFTGASVVSNAVTTLLDDEGQACIFTFVATDLYVDVNGYGSPGGSPVAITPSRLLDDREGDANDGTFDGEFVGGGPLPANTILELDVGGRGDAGDPIIPLDAKAALLNVVTVNPADSGFLAVFPCVDGMTDPPLASSVNFGGGTDVANSVTVGLGDEGKVCFFSSQATNLVVDANGFVPATGSPDPVTPFRIVETRSDQPFPTETVDGEFEGIGPLAAETVLEVQVTGRGTTPTIPEGAVSAYLNVATIDPAAAGFFTVYDCTDDPPNASNVNYDGGDIVANSVQVPLTDEGTVCVYSSQMTDFVMDITGYIVPPVGARPAVT